MVYLGQITFVRQDARDIKIGLQGMSTISGLNFSNALITNASAASDAFNQASVNLKYMNSGTISVALAKVALIVPEFIYFKFTLA